MVRPVVKQKFVVVTGPSASGKSELAMRLCASLGGEIVSCDSVQIYRQLNIGSAKPSRADQLRIRHHLIDIADIGDPYDAGRFAKDSRATLAEIQSRGRLPIIAGGTGLYLRGLLGDQFHLDLPRDDRLRARFLSHGKEHLYKLLTRLDPERAAELHPNDRLRIERALELRVLLRHPIHQLPPAQPGLRSLAFIVYLNPPRDALRQRIEKRSAEMIHNGLINEVYDILATGVNDCVKPLQSIGYAQACAFLRQQLSADELCPAISTATAQYAKRQRTWFKKLQADLEVSDPVDDYACTLDAVSRFLN